MVYIFAYPLLKLFFRLKVERDIADIPKGAHIVLANHVSMIDFLMVMLAFYPKRLNAVVAHKFFLIKPLHKVLPFMGCISKTMFDPDIKSIIAIKTVLKRGGGILLYPEGRTSISGDYVGIHRAAGKLIKKLGVPVVSCYLEGAYICVPHWRNLFRRGRVRLTFKTLITAEEAKALTIDNINNRIDARLSGAEGALPVTKPFRTFSNRRLAEGLQRILYWCPVCNSEYTTETERNEIRCTACGSNATLDCYARFNNNDNSASQAAGATFPGSIAEWFRGQVRYEAESLNEDVNPVISQVIVKTPADKPGAGTVISGEGVMSLDPTGWTFKGELFGESINLVFPIETIPAISYDHQNNFQIYSGGKYYMFLPEDRRKCLKYAILTECVHWKFSPVKQMTPGDAGFGE